VIKIVERECWNYKNCGNKTLVKNNVGFKSVICDKCRKNSLFHPDVIKQKKIMSERAISLNKNKKIIEKRTETLKKRTAGEIDVWRKKRESSLIDKYGTDWRLKQKQIMKEGMKEKYGKEFALQIDEFKSKMKQTMISRHGYENPMYEPKIVEKIFALRNQEDITKKTIETNLIKYGGKSPMSNQDIIEKSSLTRFINQQEKILKYLEEIGFKMVDKYESSHDKIKFKHIGGCGYEWVTSWNNLWNRSLSGNPCPNCRPRITNNKIAQKSVEEFLKEIGVLLLVDNRVFLGDGRELDFILENEKIAIEYCGLYWHSDEIIRDTRKKIEDSKTYHLSKLEICERKGYRLITIFEDEWIEKKDIVKSRIKQILKKSNARRIHARECEIFELTPKAKNDFLQKFHILGVHDGSFLSYGAFDKENNLIAVMTFGRPRGLKTYVGGEWEIKRFCTDYNFHSPGIAGKILHYFKNNHDWSFIVSYVDRRWSNGNLYENLGFLKEHETPPSPWVIDVNKLKRFHRSFMWKTDSEKDTEMTQEQIALSKGYKIIYDCGNIKYIQHN
jgi:hypothetical protein